jgi:opine dehydrogenase
VTNAVALGSGLHAREVLVIAVLGAGNAGRALAADLGRQGAPVTLWNRTAAHITGIEARGGIELEGDREGFGPLANVTDDLAAALAAAELIMVCVPAHAHADIATLCAPHLRDEQVVVLNPGRTFGALHFLLVLREQGYSPEIVVAEAATFLMAARTTGPAQSRVNRVKYVVPVAAVPSHRTAEVVTTLSRWYPQFTAAANTLETSFGNVGAVIHPAITLLNAARIENEQGRFDFYVDGVSSGVAQVLAAVDRERLAVAGLLGVKVMPLQAWLATAYGATGKDLVEAVQGNVGYRDIAAPATLDHRYILEDVPMSLVPVASAGRAFGLRTRAVESLILLAELIHNADYWRHGRTLESLGLDGLSPSEIRAFIERGP